MDIFFHTKYYYKQFVFIYIEKLLCILLLHLYLLFFLLHAINYILVFTKMGIYEIPKCFKTSNVIPNYYYKYIFIIYVLHQPDTKVRIRIFTVYNVIIRIMQKKDSVANQL